MAHRRISGWFFKDRLYLSAKVANELWYYGKDNSKEVQKHLVFIGWYEQKETKVKLFSFTVLWLSFQFAVNFK